MTKKHRGKAANDPPVPSGGLSSEEKQVFTLDHDDAREAILASSDFFGNSYRLQEDLVSLSVNEKDRYIVFPTKKHWCFISRKTHVSNNPYISVCQTGARFKCPDDACKSAGELPHIPFRDLPLPLRNFFTKVCYGDVDEELLNAAKAECQRNITRNFSEEDGADTAPFQDVLTTIAKKQMCRVCSSRNMQFEHGLKGWYLHCNDCRERWPTHPISLPKEDFPKMFAVLAQMNLNIGNVTLNNNNVNVSNINNVTNYMGEENSFVGDYDGDGLVVFDDEELNILFLDALKGTDAPLANLVFALYHDDFHCAKVGAKGTEGSWFHFCNHRWEAKAELKLRAMLARKEFLKFFEAALTFYEQKCLQTDDTKKKARHIKRVLDQLGDGSRRRRILEDAIELFNEHRPKFLDVLDAKNALVFTNGVYDFDTFTFREGRPDDFLSVALTVPYQPVDQLSADAAFVMDFMSAIQPNRVETFQGSRLPYQVRGESTSSTRKEEGPESRGTPLPVHIGFPCDPD